MISGFCKNSVYWLLATVLSLSLTSYGSAAPNIEMQTAGGAHGLSAETSGITFGGAQRVTIQGFSVDITAASICNDGSVYNPTGTLRLEFWAFAQPFTGQNGYKIAESLGQAGLRGGFCYNNFDSGLLSILTVPPDGTYYSYVFLTAFTNAGVDDGYSYFDITLLSPKLTVSGGNLYFRSGCTPDAMTLCLNSGRFSVVTTYQTQAGASGPGQAVAMTGDTGYFWFFSSNNVEMVLKVVDGRAVNSHYWVFAGGLTNVRVVTTVTDTQTGIVRTYVNPLNTAFLPLQDTSAFVGP
jgi:hypothetical protein